MMTRGGYRPSGGYPSGDKPVGDLKPPGGRAGITPPPGALVTSKEVTRGDSTVVVRKTIQFAPRDHLMRFTSWSELLAWVDAVRDHVPADAYIEGPAFKVMWEESLVGDE